MECRSRGMGQLRPSAFPGDQVLSKMVLSNTKSSEYAVPRHGMVRNNANVKLTNQTTDSLTFTLKYNEETLAIYPFKFEFQITYRLDGNKSNSRSQGN